MDIVLPVGSMDAGRPIAVFLRAACPAMHRRSDAFLAVDVERAALGIGLGDARGLEVRVEDALEVEGPALSEPEGPIAERLPAPSWSPGFACGYSEPSPRAPRAPSWSPVGRNTGGQITRVWHRGNQVMTQGSDR